MNYAEIKKVDIANGPGVRVSLFVSGCRNHCKGCFNPETWDFDYGRPFTRGIQGLSILGGEPAEEENAAILIPFLKRVRAALPDKDIWLYSGYTYEALRDKEILTLADVLVDGPFLLEQKDAGLAFRGSRNQRIIDLREKES